MDELRQKGSERIVLDCTELPFLIGQEDSELEVFDTTTIHAQEALECLKLKCHIRLRGRGLLKEGKG